MRNRWSPIAVLAVAGVALTITSAGGGGHRTCAPRRCGIPGAYDYRPVTGLESRPAVARGELDELQPESTPVVGGEDDVPTTEFVPSGVRSFHLSPGALRNDYCTLSDVQLVVEQDGHWTLRIDATHDRLPPEPYRRLLPRNGSWFEVRVRCYETGGGRRTVAGEERGRQLLAEIEVARFFVRSGERCSRTLSSRGMRGPRVEATDRVGRNIRKFFQSIDEVEVQLGYE